MPSWVSCILLLPDQARPTPLECKWCYTSRAFNATLSLLTPAFSLVLALFPWLPMLIKPNMTWTCMSLNKVLPIFVDCAPENELKLLVSNLLWLGPMCGLVVNILLIFHLPCSWQVCPPWLQGPAQGLLWLCFSQMFGCWYGSWTPNAWQGVQDAHQPYGEWNHEAQVLVERSLPGRRKVGEVKLNQRTTFVDLIFNSMPSCSLILLPPLLFLSCLK